MERSTLSLLLLAVAVAVTNGVTANDKGCQIPIGSIHYNRYQWPLIYKPNGELYATQVDENEVRSVQVPAGAEALFSCGPNYLKKYAYKHKEVLKVKCQGDSGNFSVALGEDAALDVDKASGIEEFACDLRVMEEVLTPVHGCSNEQWSATAFGYVDPIDKQTYILGEACYDTHEGQTIFAHVKMGDKASSYLRKLPKNFLITQRHPDASYKSELFRGLYFDELYERIRQKLKLKQAPPMHMAHYIDTTLLSNAQFWAVQKLSWNYYVEHDDLEALTALKADIRKLSAKHNLDVYVGSHGVQQLHGANGEKMELYLQPAAGAHGRFPMPELLWIVVKHEQQLNAFAVYNEAANNVENKTQRDFICESQCDKIEWLSETLKQSVNEQQPLICCSYEDLRKVVKEVPQLTK